MGRMIQFVVQEPALQVDAAAEPGHRPVGADHPVAGYDDGDRVGAVGGADRARGVAVADPGREFAVGDRLAIGDRNQLLPDRLLKRCAVRAQRQVEIKSFAGKIVVELAECFGKRRLVFDPAVVRITRPAAARERQDAQIGICAGEQQWPDQAVMIGVGQRHVFVPSW